MRTLTTMTRSRRGCFSEPQRRTEERQDWKRGQTLKAGWPQQDTLEPSLERRHAEYSDPSRAGFTVSSPTVGKQRYFENEKKKK